MAYVFNLTQHNPTADQENAGVGGPNEEAKRLLTFDTLPTYQEIKNRATALATLVDKLHPFGPAKPTGRWVDGHLHDQRLVMIGGAPYLMEPLCEALRARGWAPVFSFTERKSVEILHDGKVTKTSVFVHVGWVYA